VGNHLCQLAQIGRPFPNSGGAGRRPPYGFAGGVLFVLPVNHSELLLGSNYAYFSKSERARELIEYRYCCVSIVVR
jgi:hypothetical protein